MRSIVTILLFALIGLQYKLWVGDGGLLQSLALKKRLTIQTEKNQKLAARNHALEADIVELKRGDQALEEQARFELGMVKQHEIYYQFVD